MPYNANRPSLVTYGGERSQTVEWCTVCIERGDQLRILQVFSAQLLLSCIYSWFTCKKCIYSWFKSCKPVPHLGVEDLDLTEQNQGILLAALNEEVVDTSQEAAIDDPYQTDGGAMLKYGLQRNMVDGEYLFTRAL